MALKARRAELWQHELGQEQLAAALTMRQESLGSPLGTLQGMEHTTLREGCSTQL